MKTVLLALALLAAGVSTPSRAQQVDRDGRPVLDVVRQLKNGQFVWAPELSASGPLLMIVNLDAQRAVLFRNGVPIAATTVSTGTKGRETPTGVFAILEKQRIHFSKTYDNAPMPNMQRLTWKGIALHAGKLPGYPASHGCIRLPRGFSDRLFETTELGMTVVITEIPTLPTASRDPIPSVVRAPSLANAPYQWHPERAVASSGTIVSVVVSAADQKAVVMRGGVEIGSAPVRIRGEVKPMAYVLRSSDASGQHWLKLQYAGSGQGMTVSQDEGKRFEAPTQFRQDLLAMLRPGSVVIITPQSLASGSTGRAQEVIETDSAR